MASTHTLVHLDDVKDLAPDFGLQAMGSARFPREQLGAERIGLGAYDMNPDQRVGFGHRHAESEEVYVVLDGSGRFKVEDEVFDVRNGDIVYVRPDAMREWQAGPGGMRLLAFGGHRDGEESHMEPGWWTD